MKSKSLQKMNLFDVVANAFADKITIGASLGSFLMFKVSGFDIDLVAIAPAVLVIFAAIWKHYQKGRKEQAEAQKAIRQKELLETQLKIAGKDFEEATIENKILLLKLEQEMIKTEEMKKRQT